MSIKWFITKKKFQIIFSWPNLIGHHQIQYIFTKFNTFSPNSIHFQQIQYFNKLIFKDLSPKIIIKESWWFSNWIWLYSQTCLYGHPWDPKILAFVHRWPLLRVFSIKIAIEFDLAGLRLAVVGRWSLFRGGC